MATIVLIEDNKNILDSFEEIINQSEDHKVIGAFISCEKALEFCKNTHPDVIIIDIKLPGINGIEGIKRFQVQNPNSKSIVISVYDSSNYIFDALSAGAIGYLTKNIGPNELLNAINQAIKGGAPMNSRIARKVISYFQSPKHEALSNRENEVLNILSKGKSYATIADELNLSVHTIKVHVRNIYEKLHINNKKELIERYGK